MTLMTNLKTTNQEKVKSQTLPKAKTKNKRLKTTKKKRQEMALKFSKTRRRVESNHTPL